MLSVRDLARDLELELLAGDDAADAPVRWGHISELPDPTPWLSGGELLVTDGRGLQGGAGGSGGGPGWACRTRRGRAPTSIASPSTAWRAWASGWASTTTRCPAAS